jgi:hypothetical protein
MGSFAEKHLVEDDPHRPDVALGGVGATVEDLRAHVHRAANQRLVDLVQLCSFLVVLGKSKVCNFIGLMLNQDIGWFQVPVDDRVLVQILVASDELFHDNDALRFGQLLPLLKNVLQRPLITELLEQVYVVG